MKRILIGTLPLLAILPAVGQAEEPKVRHSIRVQKTSMDFSDHMDGPSKWELGEAGSLSLEMEGDSTVFLRNGEQEVFRLDAPEYIDAAIVSEDGSSLVLAAMKSRGFGSDFATLVLVHADGEKLSVTRVLETEQELFGGSGWWLSELGAISNDSTRILAKFGVDSRRKCPLSR